MRKSHDPVSGIEQTLVDAHKSLSVARDQERVYIRQLMPRTVYSFNISAKFIDGSWGPVVQLHAETTSDGQSALYCCSLVQLLMLFITYQCIDVALASIGDHCVLARDFPFHSRLCPLPLLHSPPHFCVFFSFRATFHSPFSSTFCFPAPFRLGSCPPADYPVHSSLFPSPLISIFLSTSHFPPLLFALPAAQFRLLSFFLSRRCLSLLSPFIHPSPSI